MQKSLRNNGRLAAITTICATTLCGLSTLYNYTSNVRDSEDGFRAQAESQIRADPPNLVSVAAVQRPRDSIVFLEPYSEQSPSFPAVHITFIPNDPSGRVLAHVDATTPLYEIPIVERFAFWFPEGTEFLQEDGSLSGEPFCSPGKSATSLVDTKIENVSRLDGVYFQCTIRQLALPFGVGDVPELGIHVSAAMPDNSEIASASLKATGFGFITGPAFGGLLGHDAPQGCPKCQYIPWSSTNGNATEITIYDPNREFLVSYPSPDQTTPSSQSYILQPGNVNSGGLIVYFANKKVVWFSDGMHNFLFWTLGLLVGACGGFVTSQLGNTQRKAPKLAQQIIALTAIILSLGVSSIESWPSLLAYILTGIFLIAWFAPIGNKKGRQVIEKLRQFRVRRSS